MDKSEIMAKIAVLEKELVRVQLMLRDLWLQVHESVDNDDEK